MIDEILKRFGNAEYSPEFWTNVNREIKEEQIRQQIADRDNHLTILKMKDKVFGPLIGD